MSLNVKNFGVLAYSNGFTLWNYSSEDTIAAMKAANYFNDVAPFARVGDMVMAVSSGTTVGNAILVISKIEGNVVTIAALS